MENQNQIVELMRARIGKKDSGSPSPFTHWLGCILKEVDPGKVTAELTVRKDMTNPVGKLHGGISSAILDDIIGATVFTLDSNNFYATINLNVDFLSSANLGDTITVTAEIIRQGRNIFNADAYLKSANGKIIAHATSNLYKIPNG